MVEASVLLNQLGLTKFVKLGDISDGYHSFNELYQHRSILFMSLVKLALKDQTSFNAFKSEKHSDGTGYPGMFLLILVNLHSKEQVSYHFDKEPYWDMCPGEEVEKAPEWDGHSSEDVLTRLTSWFL